MSTMEKTELTQERLKELLSYDPETGVFRWLVKPSAQVGAGDVAGSTRLNGYRCIKIDRHGYQAHRLAWLYVYGIWPTDQLDHKFGVRADNRIAELREATRVENGRNRKMHRNNSSGFRGVSWNKFKRKWCAQIRLPGRIIYRGQFNTAKEASDSYEAKAKELFGDFRRTA
jgi:hypothetical protein